MLERSHRALYAAFDRFPSRKGAAIHIDRFARTLFNAMGGGVLAVLGGPGLPRHQVEDTCEIVRFPFEIENFLERALRFGDWLRVHVESLSQSLEIGHFRDPWSGVAIALNHRRRYRTVYEVNALPSVELPSLFPELAPSTLEKIRATELACCDAADQIITPSQTTAAFLAALGVSRAKIEVIPNGADIVTKAARPEDAPERYILYFGAAQRWQGIDTLLRAFARLGDFPELRLVVCASNDARIWRSYKRLAAKLGIAERIVWRHALEEPELAQWKAHASLSIAPLTDTPRNVLQGCAPLKIVESMAAGLAVIASDVPPVRELIRDRDNGWLVHPERPAELARAMRILLEHPALARQLGDNARRTIEERYTWERSTAHLRAVYQTLLKRGAHAHERLDDVSIAQR